MIRDREKALRVLGMHLFYLIALIISAFVSRHYNAIWTAQWEMSGTEPTIIARFVFVYGLVYTYGVLCLFSFFVFLWACMNDRMGNKTIQSIFRLPFTVIVIVALLILCFLLNDLFHPSMSGILSPMG